MTIHYSFTYAFLLKFILSLHPISIQYLYKIYCLFFSIDYDGMKRKKSNLNVFIPFTANDPWEREEEEEVETHMERYTYTEEKNCDVGAWG